LLSATAVAVAVAVADADTDADADADARDAKFVCKTHSYIAEQMTVGEA
jgi:hypothetical protein